MTKNKLKVYHGIILIILAAIDIFLLQDIWGGGLVFSERCLAS